MLPFATKMRMGREALAWTQDDLANATNLSKPTIVRIEKDRDSLTNKNAPEIESTFNMNGVFFKDNGVEKQDIYYTTIYSDNWFSEMLDDARNHLKNFSKKELLIDGSDEREASDEAIEKYRSLCADKIKIRKLIEEGNTYILGDLENYRYIPAMFFTNLLMCVYGDRVVVERGDFKGCTLYHDPMLAEQQRKKFDSQWYNFEKPTESTAEEQI